MLAITPQEFPIRSNILAAMQWVRDTGMKNSVNGWVSNNTLRSGFGTVDHTCRNRDVPRNGLKLSNLGLGIKSYVEIHNLDRSAWIEP
jgi:hypothetical protein